MRVVCFDDPRAFEGKERFDQPVSKERIVNRVPFCFGSTWPTAINNARRMVSIKNKKIGWWYYPTLTDGQEAGRFVANRVPRHSFVVRKRSFEKSKSPNLWLSCIKKTDNPKYFTVAPKDNPGWMTLHFELQLQRDGNYSIEIKRGVFYCSSILDIFRYMELECSEDVEFGQSQCSKVPQSQEDSKKVQQLAEQELKERCSKVPQSQEDFKKLTAFQETFVQQLLEQHAKLLEICRAHKQQSDQSDQSNRSDRSDRSDQSKEVGKVQETAESLFYQLDQVLQQIKTLNQQQQLEQQSFQQLSSSTNRSLLLEQLKNLDKYIKDLRDYIQKTLEYLSKKLKT